MYIYTKSHDTSFPKNINISRWKYKKKKNLFIIKICMTRKKVPIVITRKNCFGIRVFYESFIPKKFYLNVAFIDVN